MQGGYTRIGLLIRLARFRKACREMPELVIPPHIQRVIDHRRLNYTNGREQNLRSKRAAIGKATKA